MNEWIWVIKEYRVPELTVHTLPIDQWIYTCKKEIPQLQDNKKEPSFEEKID